MDAKTAELTALMRPSVEALGYELLGVLFRPAPGGALLRVYIDQEAGVTLEDCERVSHQVSGVLDVEDPIQGHYDLEVSSPGLDRPLFEPRDFERFRGHRVRMRLSVPLAGRRRFTGVLSGMRDGAVVLEDDDGEYLIALESVDTARLVPDDASHGKQS